MKLSVSQRVIIGIFKGVNKVIDWHKLPKWIGTPSQVWNGCRKV